MGESLILRKSLDFGIRIVRLYKHLRENKREFVLSKQLLRSGTSIGANLREAKYAQSKGDFISKNSIALKEAAETEYWLELDFCKITIQTAEWRFCKIKNPWNSGKNDFCKVTIGGSIVTLQNFS